MSLSAIISSASAAIAKTQYNIAVTNTDVSNASNADYSRQSFTGTAATSTLALSSGAMQRASDLYLSRSVLNTTSSAAAAATASSYLQSYDAALGSVSGGDDISTLLTGLQTALTTLASSPSSASAQTQAVSAATAVAQKLNALSGTITSLRTQASTEAHTSITSANQLLSQIAQLNDQIVAAQSSGDDSASLQDARDAALKSLSGLMSVQTYAQADGRISVYTQSGQQLVGAGAASMSLTSDADGLHLSINGAATEVTSLGGQIGALATLHDVTLSGESDKLDQLAIGLIDSMNDVSNSASTVPAPQTLTGTRAISGASDALSASGSVRIALLDSNGALISSQDLDLSSYATIGDLVTALNGISGVSASTSGGTLSISSNNSAYGIAVGGLDSAAGASDQTFSAYFGLNDVFTGTSADTIAVRDGLTSGTTKMPTSALSDATTLSVGATGLNANDATITQKLVSLLGTARSFAVSASAIAQTTSLQSLANTFVSSAASTISSASSASAQADSVRDAAQTRLSNLTGVNLDEETAYLSQLQTQYQANAQLISVARDLFNTLLSMLS